MDKFARLAMRYRWWVVIGWIVAMVGLQAIASASGGSDFKDNFKLPNTESATVAEILTKAGLGSANGASGTVVITAKQGNVLAQEAQVKPTLQKLCTENYGIATISTPWGTISCTASTSTSTATPTQAQVQQEQAQAKALVSQDGTTALAQVQWSSSDPGQANVQRLGKELLNLDSDQLEIQLTGQAFAYLAFEQKGVPPEAIGFIAALIILTIIFRTVGGVIFPLVSAIAALGTGTALTSLLSHAMSVASFATQLQTLMVLGVGIDYALFILTRHKRNLLRGMSVEDSIANSVNTSGRAVLFAGITVCVAILGLITLDVSFLYGLAYATAIGVALTMVASLTLLPALLRFLGLRILPRKQRKLVIAGDFHDGEHRGFWGKWSKIVQKNPIPLSVITVVIIAVLAIPFFSMRLGHADQGSDPASTTTRKGYDVIAKEYGQGYNSVLLLVVQGPQARDQEFLGKVSTTLKGTRNVDPASVQIIPTKDNTVTLVNFKTTTAPQAAATTDVVKDLRGNGLKPINTGSSTHVYVYGATAIFVDFADVLASKMPLFFIAVIGLSVLLLMMAFRSIVIPLTAAVMNMLAAGASFGIVVAVFQWGWAGEALKTGGGGPIEPFLPVMFFAILFGLSMDYQVFLVSRMHEEWIHTKDNHRSVRVGQAETGGVITAAALIMITVFGGFILGDARVIKMFGIGLASAIFIDAFLLRTVLVPSVMHLLGKSNWWYPRWMEKLTPSFTVEPPEEYEGTPEEEPVPA